MARFRSPRQEAVESGDAGRRRALRDGLARVRGLSLFPDWLRTPLDAPQLDRSRFFAWLEFDTVQQMFRGDAPRGVAATLIRETGDGSQHTDRPVLLAVLEYAPRPRLLRVEAGEGVQALTRLLHHIDHVYQSADEAEVVLATEEEHETLGWLVFESAGQRLFWPAFPERYGLERETALSESQFRDRIRRQD